MDAFWNVAAGVTLAICNEGLAAGLVIGVLVALRPLTNRLLTAGQRVALWDIFWFIAGIPNLWAWFSIFQLPFPTFLDLVVPRSDGAIAGLPEFLPDAYGAGDYFIALPGGVALPVTLSRAAIVAIGVAGIVWFVAIMVMGPWQEYRLQKLADRGQRLSEGDAFRLGVPEDLNLSVAVLPGLPTSFVLMGRRRGREGKSGYQIVLQEELTPEQKRLVVLHEVEHVRRHHPGTQGIAAIGLYVYIWNPLAWLAYFLTRRDLELACDQGVLEQLDGPGRRAYARTLVELGRERPVWSGVTTFGESDVSHRVKRMATWRPARGGWRTGLGWIAVAALAVFLLLGGPQNRVLTEDLLRDLEQAGAWEAVSALLAERQVPVGDDPGLWLQGEERDGHLLIRDGNGAWWSLFVRRYRYKDGSLGTSLEPCEQPPDLEGYEQMPGDWLKG